MGGTVGAIVVGAGQGRRMGGVEKAFLPLLGRPAVAYTLDALAASGLVGAVALVLSPGGMEEGRRLLREGPWPGTWGVCLGGERRQDSVRRGLEALGEVEWVLVHDAARPCLTPGMVAEGLEAARRTGAAVAAVPVVDTIKAVDARRLVVETPERERLWAVQTPQVFRRSLLLEAHAASPADATDDAALVERLGHPVAVFPGSRANMKVTTPEDVPLVEALLRARGGGERWSA